MNACSTGTVLDHELDKILGSYADLPCILCEKERLQDYASLKIHLERVFQNENCSVAMIGSVLIKVNKNITHSVFHSIDR